MNNRRDGYETKKYNFTYKTINLTNKKYYYGCHSTNNLNDGYLGSCNILRKDIVKYGKSNFELIILDNFKNRIDAENAEDKLVGEKQIKDILCYNTTNGGKFDRTGAILSKEQKDNLSNKNTGNKHTEETKIKISKNHARANLGKRFSKEICDKMSKSHIGKKNTKIQNGRISQNHSKHRLGVKFSNSAKIKMKNTKNSLDYQLKHSKGIVITPFGIFPNGRQAGKKLKMSSQSILNICKNNNQIFKKRAFSLAKGALMSLEDKIGQKYIDIGFGFIGDRT